MRICRSEGSDAMKRIKTGNKEKLVIARALKRHKAGLPCDVDPIWAFADDTLFDIPELDAPLPRTILTKTDRWRHRFR